MPAKILSEIGIFRTEMSRKLLLGTASILFINQAVENYEFSTATVAPTVDGRGFTRRVRMGLLNYYQHARQPRPMLSISSIKTLIFLYN